MRQSAQAASTRHLSIPLPLIPARRIRLCQRVRMPYSVSADSRGGGLGCTGVSTKTIGVVRARLIKWGPVHRRRFEWRQTRSPYRVLVAEMLLQRTRAEHVPTVYRRLLEIAPTPAVLYTLEEPALSRIVQPLGLRKRVPLIRRLAQALVEQHRGRVPHDHAALIDLPGLGTYGAN